MENYREINAKTVDRWVEEGWEWGIPITSEEYQNACQGKWDILLTPTRFVPHEWFLPYIRNDRLDKVEILGLASGGGQQMPVFAALGANCTVLDYSEKQLESERQISKREHYEIKIVKGDMTQRLPFPDDSFDVIFHPVSNCYVEDVYHVWNECCRVLKKGGILLAGMDNGFNFLVNDSSKRPLVIENRLPFNPLKNPEQMAILTENDEGVQFSHTFDEQIGGQIKAGFVIAGAYEDFNSNEEAKAHGIPTFWATKAIKW